ncbi:MAG: MaoC family dehydratase N-terminal domain-containing protein [Firmicutes bacterium]|nr:MaoC family dehydratase N-terminal domain-containing protein [Bacillota bacterium]
MSERILNQWSTPVKNVVEQGAVRKFADAIGDLNPLYRDEGAAKASRYGRLIAPPTFSMTFDYGEIVGADVTEAGLIHGEQTFTFVRPLYVGETVWCSARLTDVYTRGGSLGKMTFYLYERRCADANDETILTERMTVIGKGGAEQ